MVILNVAAPGENSPLQRQRKQIRSMLSYSVLNALVRPKRKLRDLHSRLTAAEPCFTVAEENARSVARRSPQHGGAFSLYRFSAMEDTVCAGLDRCVISDVRLRRKSSESMLNKPPLPTPANVTPAADAPVAPLSRAAGL